MVSFSSVMGPNHLVFSAKSRAGVEHPKLVLKMAVIDFDIFEVLVDTLSSCSPLVVCARCVCLSLHRAFYWC